MVEQPPDPNIPTGRCLLLYPHIDRESCMFLRHPYLKSTHYSIQINGIFYLQPRQVISAINIPLSVMLSPLLACRLVSAALLSFPPKEHSLTACQILDLRERGSENVAFSDGSLPFTSAQCSGAGFQFSPHRSTTGTLSVLSTPPRTISSTRARSSNAATPKSQTAGLTFATPKSLNAGLTFTTFGSVSGVDIGDLELRSVDRDGILDLDDTYEDENDIADHRQVEFGISGIQIAVEKTYGCE
jgi:hypothetical protein